MEELKNAGEKPGTARDQQGVDKAPGEEKNKKELVTDEDLKGKKVDADPEKESDKPLPRKTSL